MDYVSFLTLIRSFFVYGFSLRIFYTYEAVCDLLKIDFSISNRKKKKNHQSKSGSLTAVHVIKVWTVAKCFRGQVFGDQWIVDMFRFNT